MCTVEDVRQKLSNVIYPGFKKSIVDFGFVQDVSCANGKVTVSLDIASSAQEIEDALRMGVAKELSTLEMQELQINIGKPKNTEESTTVSAKNITPQIDHFIMVSSGKGGVGKSTTSVNLAIALTAMGKKVGLLDADIYGPNIPRMMGLEGKEVEIVAGKVMPFRAFGVEVMSMGSIAKGTTALMWRGAMIQKAITQLLQDIVWSKLDCLIIDMPPGTGDAQLTLAQSVPVSAGINVTTPQQVALDDSRRSLEMFQKLNIPVAGIIENMSGFVCPSCHEEYDIFGSGTCEDLAKEYDTQVLARIPIEPSIRVGGDVGQPIVHFQPDCVTSKYYQTAAKLLWESIKNAPTSDIAKSSSVVMSAGASANTGSCGTTEGGCCGGGCG